jgi:hypothetical protein
MSDEVNNSMGPVMVCFRKTKIIFFNFYLKDADDQIQEIA